MSANRPVSLPPVSRWANRPHGQRLRYIAGCRCVPCRAANSRYESSRLRKRAKGDWNGVVAAGPAITHVRELSRKGMGYKAVARAARVSKTTLAHLLSGRRTRLRAQAARRLLAVRCALEPHALISAGPTWRLLQQLIAEGYPKRRIAGWLGQRGQGLQIGRSRVTVRNAQRVGRLYRFLMAETSHTKTDGVRPVSER